MGVVTDNTDTILSSSTSSKDSDECTQIVPYNPPEIIKPFHEKGRTFFLCGREWTLTQNWEQSGVAGVVWEAAIVLSNFLENNSWIVRDKRVIELGTGTGLVGMIATTLGASCVDITDKNIVIAKQNVERNLLNKSGSFGSSITTVISYNWGQPIGTSTLVPPYDLVIGSDIIYIEETYSLLIQSLKFLCTENTVVLLSSKHRYDKVENFLKLLEIDFKFHVIKKNIDTNIFIYWITLKP